MRIALACALVAGLCARAAAHPYETFVDVETEDDLHDLNATGEISDETFEALDELLARGVDLNQADREALYALPNLDYGDVDAILRVRAERGAIADPAALVAAGALTEDKLLAIAAFLIVRAPGESPWAAHGALTAQTRWSQRDRTAPPMMARGRLYTAKHVTAGLGAILTRLRLGQAVWDPDRGAILAEAPHVGVMVPKVYARWQDDQLDAIVGSYRVGFGEKLTFDDSLDYTPNGLYADDHIARVDYLVRDCKESTGELSASPCPTTDGVTYTTPDYAVRESLFGAAAGARRIDLGQGYLQAYGWVSDHRRSIYQYELYDAETCADPRSADASCGAPDVLVRPPGDVRTAAPAYSYQVVPDVFREGLVGGNATWFADRRSWIGVTGYGAKTYDLIAGANLGYQEWANRPGAGGSGFGAIGVDAAYGQRWLDVAAEVTRSFDGMHPAPGEPAHGGGGTAAVVRATATRPGEVLEASLRWYGIDFVNPYAKPIAAPDVFEGQRARDELGGRVRYLASRGKLHVRAQVDAWDLPAERVPRTNDYVRIDDAIDAPVGWGLWLQFEDKDLTAGGRGQCFESMVFVDEVTGAPALCKGMRLSTTGRLHVNPSRALRLTAQLTHRLLDDPKHPNGFRNDVMAWLLALYRPSDRVRIHGRARYLFQDVATAGYLEESLWTYGDVTVRLRDRDAVRVRADLYWWLDSRASSLTRSPNPELWLWLEYEAKF